jgi:hypothetical protein
MASTKLVVKDLSVSNELATEALATLHGGASKSIRIRANIKGGETESSFTEALDLPSPALFKTFLGDTP